MKKHNFINASLLLGALLSCELLAETGKQKHARLAREEAAKISSLSDGALPERIAPGAGASSSPERAIAGVMDICKKANDRLGGEGENNCAGTNARVDSLHKKLDNTGKARWAMHKAGGSRLTDGRDKTADQKLQVLVDHFVEIFAPAVFPLIQRVQKQQGAPTFNDLRKFNNARFTVNGQDITLADPKKLASALYNSLLPAPQPGGVQAPPAPLSFARKFENYFQSVLAVYFLNAISGGKSRVDLGSFNDLNGGAWDVDSFKKILKKKFWIMDYLYLSNILLTTTNIIPTGNAQLGSRDFGILDADVDQDGYKLPKPDPKRVTRSLNTILFLLEAAQQRVEAATRLQAIARGRAARRGN